MQSRWIIAPPEELNGGPISWSEICGSNCISRLLLRKGFTGAEEIENFLRPRLSLLGDPFLLPGMEAAVKRILEALDRRERIALFGDYDVDGVTSLALLAQMLRSYGASPDLFLPLRMEEGYGLSSESVSRCCELYRPQLLIAVDCGTSSVAEIADLRQRGIDVLVLDHHEPKSSLPDCVAIVNPKIKKNSPAEYLCSVGIVFKLCHALLKTRPLPSFDLRQHLDLVALGTVADIVPLHQENRVLVQRGALQLARSTRPGMRKLMEVAAVRAPISPEDIGFRLGPRLNAAGRLHTAEKALRLLLTEDEDEATELATLLDEQNRERQAVEKQIFAEADEKVARDFDPAAHAAIVVGARAWHPGVLGIVASRITRKYHRPTIVVGFDETGLGKGSGRSIEGFSLVGALTGCSGWLAKFGGHEMAAGLTVTEENFASFAEDFRRIARGMISDDQLQPCLHIDHELSFPELNYDFLRWHEMLQPFGSGNPQPVFVAREVEPASEPRIVKEKHVVLRLRQHNYHQRAIFFDGAMQALPPTPWDVAFRITSDEYRGRNAFANARAGAAHRRSNRMLELSQALTEIEWIPRAKIVPLRRLGIETVEDLLTHFPKRHEDRTEFPHFPREEGDQSVCLCGEVVKTQLRRFGGWKKIFEATLQETNANALSQPLVCRWFNLHYVQKMIATGQRLVVFGKPRLRGQRLCMEHPEFEVIENDDEISIHFRRIAPIYPATEGLSQRVLRSLIYRVLESVDLDSIETLLPRGVDLGERSDAMRQIHFPESQANLGPAREHLVYSEFFAMQMLIGSRRSSAISRSGRAHCGTGALLARFLRDLPFDLTNAQERVIDELRHDLAADQPMNRLLQGDVGSGKTVVAIAAMLLAVEARFQTALMAPTQILAEQHYAVLCRWLEPLGIKISLRTADRQEENFLPLISGNESPDILIGTHALLYEGVSFDNLGLVVIDEQHKFGVSQRARLTAREPAPDVLVMTATPIPRTLTMTVYGDLDVSVIDEMPLNRGRIITAVRDQSKLGEVLSFMRERFEAGRQAYIVYPLIDESEKLDVKAAAAEFETWRERLRPFRCELLHGRIPSLEKQSIMERFRRGETSALISTTVIEVGVDVPNATIMLIENAERFGLAQLHQLRGRIGRGEHKSYCILLSTEKSPETVAKLAVLEKTNNGFEIAEADWELRGPGDLLGTAQSGLPALKLGNLKTDAALMRNARIGRGEDLRVSIRSSRLRKINVSVN